LATWLVALGGTALIASYVASALAFLSAAVTAYWLFGGTALLETVGGSLEPRAVFRTSPGMLVPTSAEFHR
jgi:hypothetical protein